MPMIHMIPFDETACVAVYIEDFYDLCVCTFYEPMTYNPFKQSS